MADVTPTSNDKLAALLGNSHVGILSPIETRLITIAMQAFRDTLLLLRISQGSTEMKPMTPELVATAMRLALAGAVAIDEDMRALRDSLEARRG